MRGFGHRLGPWIERALGIVGVSPFALIHEDRRVLERTIFPSLIRRDDIRRILFVGCEWYTRRYEWIFRSRDYWTLEKDPGKRRYGADNHVIGRLEHLGRYFAPGSLDLIICNGVYGWGLNVAEDGDRAFAAAFEALREGGLLLLGWNDVPERRPFPLADCPSLARFARYRFEPLAAEDYLTNTPYRHVYSFYARSRGP